MKELDVKNHYASKEGWIKRVIVRLADQLGEQLVAFPVARLQRGGNFSADAAFFHPFSRTQKCVARHEIGNGNGHCLPIPRLTRNARSISLFFRRAFLAHPRSAGSSPINQIIKLVFSQKSSKFSALAF